MGYSFGASVAFEMSLQLERDNVDVVSLTLLDGSHSYVGTHIQHHVDRLSSETNVLQAEGLTAFALQLCDVDKSAVSSNM